MSPSDILKELQRQADENYQKTLAEVRARCDESILRARETEKQVVLNARQKIFHGNARVKESKDRIERTIRQHELSELTRDQERSISEASVAARRAILQAREVEKRSEEEAKNDRQEALRQAEHTASVAIRQAKEAALLSRKQAEEKRKADALALGKREQEAREKAIRDKITERENARQAVLAEKAAIAAADIARAAAERQAREDALEARDEAVRRKEEEAKKLLDERRLAEAQAKKEKQEALRLVKQKEMQEKEAAKQQAKNIKTPGRNEKQLSDDITMPLSVKGETLTLEARMAAKNPPRLTSVATQQGIVKLIVSSHSESGQVRELENHLRGWPDVKLLMIGGEDSEIQIIVSTNEPVGLVDRLASLTIVQDVQSKGELIRITLKGDKL